MTVASYDPRLPTPPNDPFLQALMRRLFEILKDFGLKLQKIGAVYPVDAGWDATGKVLQIGPRTTLSSLNTTADTFLSNNARWTGSLWKYTATDGASFYEQTQGTHVWYTAVSGTAGTTITYTTALQITTGGGLQGKVVDKAGAVVAADIPSGFWQIIHDTSGATTKLYANIGGSLKAIALT